MHVDLDWPFCDLIGDLDSETKNGVWGPDQPIIIPPSLLFKLVAIVKISR
jgi:hypothetical protein